VDSDYVPVDFDAYSILQNSAPV